MPTYGAFSGRQTNPMTEAKKRGAALRMQDVLHQLGMGITDYQTDLGKYQERMGTSNVAGNILSALIFKGMPGGGLLEKGLKTVTKTGAGSILGNLIANLSGVKKPELPSAEKFTSQLTGPYMQGGISSIYDMLEQAKKGAEPTLSGIGQGNLLTSLLMSGYPEFGPDIRKLLGLVTGGGDNLPTGSSFYQGYSGAGMV